MAASVRRMRNDVSLRYRFIAYHRIPAQKDGSGLPSLPGRT